MDKYELTAAEKEKVIAEALKKAQDKKRWEVDEQEKINQRKEAERVMLTPWSADQYLSYVQKRALSFNKELVIDEYNRNIIMRLCLYFANDKGFEKDGYSLNKGIALSGNIGAGKTFIMRLFSRNQRRCYNMAPVRKVCDYYEVTGSDILHEYSNPEYFIPTRIVSFNQNEFGRCFDDLGAENTSKNEFGNRNLVMREIIQNIYDRQTPYFWYHLTMNLNQKQIATVYGERVLSRMKEMFNFFEIKGQDRRQ